MMKGKIQGGCYHFGCSSRSSKYPNPYRKQAYFLKLGLPDSEAQQLHHVRLLLLAHFSVWKLTCSHWIQHYYTSYGLAIRGLVKHHEIDALDYDKHCDAALPLELVLKDDKELRDMLNSIDRKKCRVWALTNAYYNVSITLNWFASFLIAQRWLILTSFSFFSICTSQHAVRVLKLLGLTDCFEGVVSCDYGAKDFSCKPEAG